MNTKFDNLIALITSKDTINIIRNLSIELSRIFHTVDKTSYEKLKIDLISKLEQPYEAGDESIIGNSITSTSHPMFNIKPIITLGMIENIHNSNNIIYASQILGNELINTSFKSLYLNFMNSEYTTETFILILENKTMKIILNKIDENQVILEENFPMY